MKMKKTVIVARTFAIALAAMALSAVINAAPVFFLWNWLMPDLFNITEINFLQSCGMSLMCGFLFRSIVKVDT